jgi:[ribosomal protein S5]-alanine N-acetyltransferase
MIYDLNDAYFVRSLAEHDVDGPYPSWFEDQDVCRYNSHGKVFRTRQHFKDYVALLDRGDRLVWAICHRTDGHVGNVSLQDISAINQHGEFAIIVGNKAHWGTGVATLAGRKLLEHGFLKLNLQRIHCGTAATNKGMQRLARNLGMQLEGTRRSHLWLEGQWVDVLEYGVLRAEFLALHSHAEQS